MEASGLHEPTRKFRVRIRQDLSARHNSDPVVIYTMGLLENEAGRFGKEQRDLICRGKSSEKDVRYALRVHVALADSGNNLTPKQMEYLTSICFTAAGLGRASIDNFD